MFEAVIFDLDGTLLDTIEDLADSMNAVLRERLCPLHEVNEYKSFVGEGMETLVRRALPPEWRDEERRVSECLQAMRRGYAERWKEKTRPYDGIPRLLEALSERGVRKAVLSNKPDDFTKVMVAECLGSWHFGAVFGERPPVPRKPDPAVALEISSLFQIPVHQFLFLGDSRTDMLTASAAGMFPVGALWGFRQADELLASGARALLPSPFDLLELL